MEKYVRNISRTFPTGDNAHLDVSSRNGHVIVRAHDLPDVRVNAVAEVHAESAAAAEREFQTIEAGITHEGNRVAVRVPAGQAPRLFAFGRGTEVHFEITAPRRTSAEFVARNGRVDLGGIRGPATIESRNGRVQAEGIEDGAVITSHNGRVEVRSSSGGIKVSGHNGSVTLERIEGPASAETHNGEIVAGGVTGRLTLRSHNGSIRYTGAVLADLDIEVVSNGSIRLAVPGDSRFALDAEAVNGSVNSALPVKEQAASGDPRPSVRLRTVNGSIRIEAAAPTGVMP